MREYRFNFLLLITAVITIYYAGTSGIFLLDDHGTLAALGNWGEINSWSKWVNYVTSAYSGPNGRLIPVASFTLNAQSWPATPYWFLITNIVIHSFNACLLYIFLRKLLTYFDIRSAKALSILTASIWALHPLQVSTVLYAVQRMAELELTFNLIALISYLTARFCLDQSDYRKGISYLAISGLAAGAALYCKETAILIPLQLLLMELLLLRSERIPKWPSKHWAAAIVYIPVCVVAVLMIEKLSSYFGSSLLMERRGFSVQERLLTELRVVGDYLCYFFAPQVQTAGVFYDGYPLSRGLFQPLSTVVWALAHSSLYIVAFACRRHLPVITLGILWFYGNHLIESVVVQLEIKYEHRNYMPSIGLALIVAYGLVKLSVSKNLKRMVASVVVLVLAGATYARASLWGNPDKAVLVWMDENPASTRALETAILHYSQKPGADAVVHKLLSIGLDRDSKDPVILLKALSYDCSMLSGRPYTAQALIDLLAGADMQWQMGALLEGVLTSLENKPCSLINKEQYQAMLEAVRGNSAFRKTRVHWVLDDLNAKSEFLLGDRSLAIQRYKNIKWRDGMLGLRMNQALLLASNNHQKAAADILEAAIVNAGQEDQRLVEPAKDMLGRIKQDIKDDH